MHDAHSKNELFLLIDAGQATDQMVKDRFYRLLGEEESALLLRTKSTWMLLGLTSDQMMEPPTQIERAGLIKRRGADAIEYILDLLDCQSFREEAKVIYTAFGRMTTQLSPPDALGFVVRSLRQAVESCHPERKGTPYLEIVLSADR
jgi:hypothetical protein